MTRSKVPWAVVIPIAVLVAVVTIAVTGFAIKIHTGAPVDHSSNAAKFCTIFRVRPSDQLDQLRHPAVPNDPAFAKSIAGLAKTGVLTYVPAQRRHAAVLYNSAVDAIAKNTAAVLTPQQLLAVAELDRYVGAGCPR